MEPARGAFRKMKSSKRQIYQLLAVIIVCEILQLLFLFNLGPDTRVGEYSSVQALLAANAAQTNSQSTLGLASRAIRVGTQSSEILSVAVVISSLIVVGTSVLILFRVKKSLSAKEEIRT